MDIGTTGYTLNNVFVLYDRETGSVWYPLREGEFDAVAGPDKGKRMDFISEPPKMPLGEWVKKHPGTVVMLPGANDRRRRR